MPATNAGCRRIELNAPGSYVVGGTTPPLDLVREVMSDLKALPFPVPLRVMIRPRGGDFIYNAEEKKVMLESILAIKNEVYEAAGDGFVIGALRRNSTGDLEVDWPFMRDVLQLCYNFAVVLHRAFDDVALKMGGVVMARNTGSSLPKSFLAGILTSGGPGNAIDNLEGLAGMVEANMVSNEPVLDLIVGGGVRSSNVKKLFKRLRNNVSYHSSCLSDPTSSEDVDPDEVSRIVRVLHGEDSDDGKTEEGRRQHEHHNLQN
jgi:copper homeostasis protein